MKVPEKYRLTNHPQLGSDSSYGCNGFFIIPHPNISLYYIQCQVSDGMGWQHVSVSLVKDIGLGNKRKFRMVERCPTWEEMCFLKNLFWDEDETVVQYHPAKSEYVNCHPYCLHLWRAENFEMPTPDSLMVGIKNDNND